MEILQSANINKIASLINNGQVGVLPTDTIYGLVCKASDQSAVARLYKIKSRTKKPGTVIAADTEQLVTLGVVRRYLKAVEQFWPGPVSIEIPNHIDYLNCDTGRQAFRIPSNKELHNLLVKTGPLLTSSANKPDQPVANNLEEAQNYFGDRIDFYVDGGDLSKNLPSTIIRIVDDAIDVIREGAVKIQS